MQFWTGPGGSGEEGAGEAGRKGGEEGMVKDDGGEKVGWGKGTVQDGERKKGEGEEESDWGKGRRGPGREGIGKEGEKWEGKWGSGGGEWEHEGEWKIEGRKGGAEIELQSTAQARKRRENLLHVPK